MPWLVGFWFRVQLVRHVVALIGHVRVRRFLAAKHLPADAGPEIFVVLPVLGEADSLEEAVRYFTSLISEGDSVLVVTSDREGTTLPLASDGRGDTVELARSLARRPMVLHAHLEDPTAFKADQLNYAALLVDNSFAKDPASAVLVVYDVDSRPDPTSIAALRASSARWPHVSVFQQSSRFRLQSWDSRVCLARRLLADAGALRANRFVMSTELPRLLARRPTPNNSTRITSRLSYGHLVGHGLAIRAQFLISHPMPDHTPMEDMFYGFQMAARSIPIVPLPQLDNADVPSSAAEQFRQLERWFLGPSRFTAYVRHPDTPRGPVTVALAAMAFLITIEWLTAVASAPLVVASTRVFTTRHHRLILATVMTVACELVSAELTLGSARDGWQRRAARIALYPVAASAFGLAGWSSLAKRLAGRSVDHKTNHPGAAET